VQWGGRERRQGQRGGRSQGSAADLVYPKVRDVQWGGVSVVKGSAAAERARLEHKGAVEAVVIAMKVVKRNRPDDEPLLDACVSSLVLLSSKSSATRARARVVAAGGVPSVNTVRQLQLKYC